MRRRRRLGGAVGSRGRRLDLPRYRRPGSSTDNWQWRLSGEGQRVVKGGSWEPRDPDGYLDRVRRDIPTWMSLSSCTSLRRCSHSMGGATSRRRPCSASPPSAPSWLWLSRMPRHRWPGLQPWLGNPPGPAVTTSRSGRSFASASSRFDRICRIADALTLDAIADLIRLTRNKVGHPSGRQIDEDTARVHLTIAPMYLRKMQQLADTSRRTGGLRHDAAPDPGSRWVSAT